MTGAGQTDLTDSLDDYLDRGVRLAIESRYLAPITALGDVRHMLGDQSFLDTPVGHPALFADHGVTHARDVAGRVLQVLDTVHGRLIPLRTPDRLRWMKAYGALLALVHDIGMVDASPEGRKMHPEYAALAILGSDFDDIFAAFCAADRCALASRVMDLPGADRSGPTALREMIAMALCHSKSKVTVDQLNDPASLRRVMQRATGEPGPARAATGRFGWLTSFDPAHRKIAEDVIDTLRALRCADALRMRGTLLKTSGQYEVFVDQRSAHAIYALRADHGTLCLLEVPDPVAVGEANLSGCQLDDSLDLRTSFHHGQFGSPEAVQRAADCAAMVVSDIFADAIESFGRADLADHPGLGSALQRKVLVEAPDDNPAFAGLVRDRLTQRNPALAHRVRIVPSLALTTPTERARYLSGADIDWDAGARRAVLADIGRSGFPGDRVDSDLAFRHVRIIGLSAGDQLIEAGAPSGFVYVPLAAGLKGRPLGGYDDFSVGAHTVVGVTGVVRGSTRNSDVFATVDLQVLAIPKPVFLDHWYFTFGPEALRRALYPDQAVLR